MRSRIAGIGIALLFVLGANAAQAHSFGRMYNLPVPVWLYLYAAAAALMLSFVVIGLFVARTPDRVAPRYREIQLPVSGMPVLAGVLRTVALLALILCVAAGYAGTRDAYQNINMTLFWVIFALGLTYLIAATGNWYAVINPWQSIAAGVSKVWQRFGEGILTYPARLGYWPAVTLYMGFIWVELFGNSTPMSLSHLLSGYTLLNLVGVWLFGRRTWFARCEFFSVFFALVAKMAPVQMEEDASRAGQGRRLRLYPPFLALLNGRVTEISLLVFILFMLSSTAFDGLRETVAWRRWFWVDLYHAGLKDLSSANPLAAYPKMNRWYYWWQYFWLLVSPFVYLAVYWLFIWLTRLFARSALPVRELALRFGYSLLPIVLVYNVTHYYTLIQIQGIKIVSLASDPFGKGWDLFGTADFMRMTIIPDAERVWHVQVGLIVFGHIVSVWIAHLEALRTFPTHRQAVLSQIPMLVLMVIFTTVGLWILSEPLQPGA